MATYLDIANKVLAQSGTVSLGQPFVTMAAVDMPSPRHARIAQWVQDAWLHIQTLRDDWRFRRARFAAPLMPGVGSYAPEALGLADHGAWLHDMPADDGGRELRQYALAEPDEIVAQGLGLVDIAWLIDAYVRRPQEAARPSYIAIDDTDALVVAPVPDKAYILTGGYLRAPQILELASDRPAVSASIAPLVARAILWRALVSVAEFDEARDQLAIAAGNYQQAMQALSNQSLPRMTF